MGNFREADEDSSESRRGRGQEEFLLVKVRKGGRQNARSIGIVRLIEFPMEDVLAKKWTMSDKLLKI